MNHRANLQAAIADTIWTWTASRVEAVCERLGLARRGAVEDEPFRSKRAYAQRRLDGLDYDKLLDVGRRLWAETGSSHSTGAAALGEVLRLIDSPPRVTEFTRRRLAAALDELEGGMFGDRSALDVLPNALQDLDFSDQYGGLRQEIVQHTIRNDDWRTEDYFQRLGLLTCSDHRLFRVLAEVVHPLSRAGDDQDAAVRAINEHIQRDGFTLVAAGQMSGYPTYAIVPAGLGVEGRPKNLIFASTGRKPEIVFRDAINNDIAVVKYGEHCLIFDEPFPDGVFTWGDLAAWWARLTGTEAGRRAEEGLFLRLWASVKATTSPPEQLLFHTYYGLVKERGTELPVLLPQVYLHFDPMSAHMLGGATRLVRQRMDFLLLLSHRDRIVIEVDGKQHYADGDLPSPRRYGEMMAEDRKLRLAGYEVYRFGGAELQGEGGQQLAKLFFRDLFRRHAVFAS